MPQMMAALPAAVIALASAALVAATLLAATRTFVLPRGDSVWLTRYVFIALAALFSIPARRAPSLMERDRIQALYAPVALLALPLASLALVLAGYTGLFWSAGVRPARQAFLVSGSSLLTLGFAPVSGLPHLALAFTEAAIGLSLVALIIAYLPAIYGGFARREAAVALLEVYAGAPPSAVAMLSRVHRIRGLAYLGEVWADWERWFAEIEESHTSLAPLVFFRSQRYEISWVTAGAAVLDAAALARSSIDIPRDPRADLCIRAGYLALRRIAGVFRIPYDSSPRPTDPISIARSEFDAALDALAKDGLPLNTDRDQAWRDFAGWRVNYDTVLLALADITSAPPAAWSADRAVLPAGAPASLRWLRRHRDGRPARSSAPEVPPG